MLHVFHGPKSRDSLFIFRWAPPLYVPLCVRPSVRQSVRPVSVTEKILIPSPPNYMLYIISYTTI